MKERVRIAIAQYFPWMIAFIISLIGLRLYEAVLIMSKLEEGSSSLSFGGLAYDFSYAITSSLLILILYLPFSFISIAAARAMAISLLTLILLGSFAIIQYFTETLLPLSADFYGYSLSEISTTVSSSGGSSWFAFLIAVLWVTAFVGLGLFLQSKFSKDVTKWQLTSGATLVLLVFLPNNPQPEKFQRTLDYYVALNKPAYFIEKSQQYWEETHEAVGDITGYPLLHRVQYSDALSEHLNKAASYPNIVVIIVEGLGRDFTGPDAHYGGFTPFLDSLAQVSLSWNNMLSNAGRTFGALPNILGSLPYGESGFMGYGTKMPNHQTLISLLKSYGYTSRFFYGGNPNFDNQDLFLERNGIDFMLNESNFPDSYSKMEGTDAGSWGYGDKDVFTEAMRILAQQPETPRLDIFLTLTTHEPFISPEEKYSTQFEEKLKSIPDSEREVYTKNSGVFSCLLYTDDAIRQVIKSYSKRKDFEKTLFIITGDHRLIPMPSDNPMARFHVPLIMYSSMLKKTVHFNGVSAHSGITPTILGWLKKQFAMEFPTVMPFMTDSLSFSQKFKTTLDLPLTRNKNVVEDYVDGDYFLSSDRLYKINQGLKLQSETNQNRKKLIREKLTRFKKINRFICNNNRVDSIASGSTNQFILTESETNFLSGQNVSSLNPIDQFEKARKFALNKQYKESRTCLKYLLNESPNFHDARVLLARTYGWNGSYDSARLYLEQTMKRAPHYPDAYVALIDVAYWSGDHQQAELLADEGLNHHAFDLELQARKARSLFLKNNRTEAKRMIEKILSQQPNNEIALDLKSKLNR